MSRHYGRFERTSMDAQTLLVVKSNADCGLTA